MWATLFGLLFWSVLFAEVPEVFRTPFQSAPLDLGSDTFAAARRPLLDARLQEIRCPPHLGYTQATTARRLPGAASASFGSLILVGCCTASGTDLTTLTSVHMPRMARLLSLMASSKCGAGTARRAS